MNSTLSECIALHLRRTVDESGDCRGLSVDGDVTDSGVTAAAAAHGPTAGAAAAALAGLCVGAAANTATPALRCLSQVSCMTSLPLSDAYVK